MNSRAFYRSFLAALLLSLAVFQGTSAVHAATGSSAEQSVAAHLEAGEFLSALEVAAETTDEAEKAALLTQIAAAQQKQGNLSAARGTLRRVPQDRTRPTRETASRPTLQGSMADFEPLKQLIMSVTSPPAQWQDQDGIGGTMREYDNGVRVDPHGLLVRMTRTEETQRLKELGLTSRQASLNTDMAQQVPLRMVSLTRLEQAVAERLAQGQPVVESMKNLAGLYQIQHVFVYPETGEIVIAGPAAGWQYNEKGMSVSTNNLHPTLQLDDLVTVLRTFSPEGNNGFGCSIDPRAEGLQKLKEYVETSQTRGPISSGAVRSWTHQLQNKLGLQDVVVYGIPADSRVARVIVEADFRMKLIGIGKLEAGSNIPDYFELMTAQQAAQTSQMDALRWWLSLQCEAVLKSEDSKAFELQNSSVLCQSENQFISAEGKQVPTGQAEETNRQFAANFTKHYQELAERDIVFADMQNVFDLALVAALIQKEQLADTVGWDYGVFATNGSFDPARYEAPAVVDSVVNHKVFSGKNIVVQVAGGVEVNPLQYVNQMQSAPRLDQVARSAQPEQLPAGRWWWDVKK